MIIHNGKTLCTRCFEELEANTAVCPHCGYSEGLFMQLPIALPIGTVLIGKYVIGQVLGKGGFGITYLAYDLVHNKPVAIKEYLPDALIYRTTGDTLVSTYEGEKAEAFQAGAEKFFEEAQTIAKFNRHPNIINVTEFFYENNTVYFVMEYLKGVDLKTYVARHGGRLSEKEVLTLLLPIFDALIAIHLTGLLHRDISPDNIYVGQDGSVKLIDFGAARQVIGEQSKSLSVVLKQGFSPVEQYQTRGKQGEWTDIYALAATMYYCLTGKVPESAMDRVEEDDMPSPNHAGAHISPRLEASLMKAMSVRVAMRYQNVSEFKAAVPFGETALEENGQKPPVALVSEDAPLPEEGPRENQLPAAFRKVRSAAVAVAVKAKNHLQSMDKQKKLITTIASALILLVLVTGVGSWAALRHLGYSVHVSGDAKGSSSAASSPSTSSSQAGSSVPSDSSSAGSAVSSTQTDSKPANSSSGSVTSQPGSVTPPPSAQTPVSGDCSLKILSVADNPTVYENFGRSLGFDPNVTEYETTVMDDLYSPTIRINAVPNDSGAQVSLSGPGVTPGNNLVKGDYNLIQITVTAPSGAARTYKIKLFYSTNEYNNYIGNLKDTDKVFVENIKYSDNMDLVVSARLYNRENVPIIVTNVSLSIYTDIWKNAYVAQKSFAMNTAIPVGGYAQTTMVIPNSEIVNKNAMLLMADLDSTIIYHN